MKVIAVANQKGGVGKSATCIALARGLSDSGKVLLIDTDRQCSITSVIIPEEVPAKNIKDVLTGTCKVADAITHTENGDIIAATPYFGNEDIKNPSVLRNALNGLNYDYVIIDTPPTLGEILVAVLMAADYVLIPTKASKYGINSFYQFMDTFNAVKQKNTALKVIGILPTMHQARSVLFKQYLAELKRLAAEYGIVVLEPVRSSVIVEESAAFNSNVFDYSPSAPVTDDYRTAIIEIREQLK